MQPTDIQTTNYISTNDLYEIVSYYMIVMKKDVAYGNGFDKNGKKYIVDLCRYFPEFAEWFAKNYPNAWSAAAKECKFETKWSQEISDSINVLF